jgi:uncharacterized glyoxalase superfamily protein PhnB
MGELRLGLRVGDVTEAAEFYGGLGFEREGEVSNPRGEPVMVILRRDGSRLIADALLGMPFPDSQRERSVQRGPRGLGVVIGLGVEDLEATYDYCVETGCKITSEPRDEPWGERVFTCLDPFGYEWEFTVPIPDFEGEGTAAAEASWYG